MINPNFLTLICNSDSSGERLDSFLYAALIEYIPSHLRPMFNRSQVIKYLDFVTVNGESQKKGSKLKEGDEVSVDIESIIKDIEKSIAERSDLIPEEGGLNIIEESDDWLVINKPKGVVVHPGEGNWKGTLANFVKGYLEGKGEFDERVERAGIVHRLDKGVSGLMIVAKNLETQLYLKKEFEEHRVVKVYRAHIEGVLNVAIPFFKGSVVEAVDALKASKYTPQGWYELVGYVGRDSRQRQRMRFSPFQIDSTYKSALSYILRLSDDNLLIKIETGRMHQIRASLRYLGVNIVGDSLYAKGKGSASDSLELESVHLGVKLQSGEFKDWSIV